ncbi:hypothetical protein Hanom_Chr14g01284661 [Helianthus anomalus]
MRLYSCMRTNTNRSIITMKKVPRPVLGQGPRFESSTWTCESLFRQESHNGLLLQPSRLKRVGERSDLSCCRISSRIRQQVSNFHLYHDYETVNLISDETMLSTTLLNCRIF